MIIPGVETTDVQRLRDILLTFIFEKVKCVESSLYGKCSYGTMRKLFTRALRTSNRATEWNIALKKRKEMQMLKNWQR